MGQGNPLIRAKGNKQVKKLVSVNLSADLFLHLYIVL